MKHLKFIVFSIMGVFLFLIPFTINGNKSIFISHFSNLMLTNFYDFVLLLILSFSVITIVTATVGFFYTYKHPILNKLFHSSNVSATLEILGSITILLVFFQVGPEVIWHEYTGQVMFGLVEALFLTFFAGVMLMPLLTRFGLVEFIGTILNPVMRKVFKVPGSAAIDGLSSIIGDGTLGILVTEEQYVKGYYTQKEAAFIASTFSIVGIAFTAVVASELGFASIFPIFYGSIFLVVIIVAMIMTKLPYKKFKDEYYDGSKPTKHKEPKITIAQSYELAVSKADKVSILPTFGDSFLSVIRIYLSFIPTIMLVGTIALILAENTNLFVILSAPLVPILLLFGFTQEIASQMAPALIVGFADMYLPTLFIMDSTSTIAKFIVGVMSFCQLIFLAETGMVLVNTKLGFNFIDVIKLFFIRSIISFPFVFVIAHIVAALGII